MTGEELTKRVRAELAGFSDVVEKRMFGGVAFMVNGKMCLTVGPSRMMIRIDPAIHDQLVQRDGCRPVIMRGREYRGYVRIDKKALEKNADLKHWLRLALEFNKRIKTSRKTK